MPIPRVVRSFPQALPCGAGSSSQAVPPSWLQLLRRHGPKGFPVPEAPDPILDAIEGHRRVFEELRRLLAEQDAKERELRRAPGGRRGVLEAQLVGLCEAEGLLGCAESKASLRLAKTVPVSLTGAAAALRYVRERYEIGQYPMYEEYGYRLLLFSTERAICASAGLAVPHRGQ